ncbi:hypothetical protein K491DRAFT_556084, partial [Lophiostoma macrostomum CBS 122681]
PGFKYTPLGNDDHMIRIIRFQRPAVRDGPIKCTIHHVAYPEANFVCLSYRWGTNGRPKRRILIDGDKFDVQENLWEFLNVASQKYASELFWIDAISIDQQNTIERNQQVQQMGELYSHAQQVITWMG